MVKSDDYELLPATSIRKLENEIKTLKADKKESAEFPIDEINKLIHTLIEVNIIGQQKLIESVKATNELTYAIRKLISSGATPSDMPKAPIFQGASAADHKMDLLVEQNKKLTDAISDLSKHMKRSMYLGKYESSLPKLNQVGVKYLRTK